MSAQRESLQFTAAGDPRGAQADDMGGLQAERPGVDAELEPGILFGRFHGMGFRGEGDWPALNRRQLFRFIRGGTVRWMPSSSSHRPASRDATGGPDFSGPQRL